MFFVLSFSEPPAKTPAVLKYKGMTAQWRVIICFVYLNNQLFSLIPNKVRIYIGNEFVHWKLKYDYIKKFALAKHEYWCT